MKPITKAEWPEGHHVDVLEAPPGAEGEVSPLPVVYAQPRWPNPPRLQVVSGWKLSWAERLKVLLTGRVWLGVLGETHPPVWLDAGECPLGPSKLSSQPAP